MRGGALTRPKRFSPPALASRSDAAGKAPSQNRGSSLCLRQWLRLRLQLLRPRPPRLYSGGGAESAWPPSGFFFPPPPPAERMWYKPGWFRARQRRHSVRVRSSLSQYYR